MAFATIGNAYSLIENPEVNLRHYSTAEEYFDATVKHETNDASKHIDAGREPYLVNMELVEFSMHPFHSIHDIMIARNEAGEIGLDCGYQTYYVGRNTLLAWIG